MVRDLSITALYTAQTWAWGELACAELLTSTDSKRVFAVTNAALAAARLFDRRHPPLRVALLQRHAMIDRIVRESRARRVIELAAGLSRRGAAISADPAIDYTELDRAAVIDYKRELFDRTARGKAVLARSNFRLVAGDALATPLAHADLAIAEGLAMYLDRDARRALYANVRALGDIQFVFDLTPSADEPPPGRIGRALEAMMKRFTGGRTFERDARTRGDVIAELHSAGFADARAIAATDVAHAWRLPFADTATATVIFVARATSR
jgi:O-methyltransferase involved in polyketide biosynthesis